MQNDAGRKLNNRPMLFFAISLILGVVLSSYSIIAIKVVISLIFLSLLLVVRVLTSNGDGLPKSIVTIGMVAVFCLGIAVGTAENISYSKMAEYQKGEFYATVVEINSREMIVEGISMGEEEIDGRARLHLSNSTKSNVVAKVGDVVKFSQTLKKEELFPNGKLNFGYSQDIKYSSNLSEYIAYRAELSIKNKTKRYIMSAMQEMFPENYGSAYAMMFGDTAWVEGESLGLLRRGGIAHIFAVSGLHIAILYSAIRMLHRPKGKASRRRKMIYNILVTMILLFYVYLCNFTASSMRAFLMIVCGFVAMRFGQNRERISTISFVAFILVLHSPYILFSVGFQLSFLAVVGIALIAPQLRKHMGFIHNEKVASAVAISTSAFFGTFAVACFHFGYSQTLSILLNIIFVPIYSVVYVANLVGVLIFSLLDVCSLEVLKTGLTPYFTEIIYSKTLLLFQAIEEIVPLAIWVDISSYVAVGYCFCIVAFSGLISKKVAMKKRIVASVVVFAMCLSIGSLSKLPESEETARFYVGGSIVEINTATETFIYSEGGKINLENARDKVDILLPNGFEEKVSIVGKGERKVSVYSAREISGVEEKSLFEYRDKKSDVTLHENNKITYGEIAFIPMEKDVKVQFGEEEFLEREDFPTGKTYRISNGKIEEIKTR